MKHLHKFNSISDYNAAKDSLDYPYIYYIDDKSYYSNTKKFNIGDIISYKGHKCVCYIPSDCVPDKKARFVVADNTIPRAARFFTFNYENTAKRVYYPVHPTTRYKIPYYYKPTDSGAVADTAFKQYIIDNNNDINRINGIDYLGILPLDHPTNASYISNPIDISTSWSNYNETSNGKNIYLPSPYIHTDENTFEFNNGIFNYPNTSFVEFNGLELTKYILNFYYNTDYTEWNFENKDDFDSSSYDRSNFQCAVKKINDSFNENKDISNNINNIKFYLPSIAELLCLMSRVNYINSIIQTIDGGRCIPMNSTSTHLASTAYNNNGFVYIVYSSTGYVRYAEQNSGANLCVTVQI